MKRFLKKILGKETIARLWHLPKAVLAAALYGFPGRSLTVIAVAGTKGKTSTAYFISQLLDKLGIANVLFSTAALKINGEESLNSLKLTTPTPFFLQRFLYRAKRRGCTHAVLEVSSHAIVQRRLWGVPLQYVVLTNLMPDHQEFHASGKEYQQTHLALITSRLKLLVLNGDDPNLTSFQNLSVPQLVVHESGSFQESNIACARAAVESLGIKSEKIIPFLASLRSAPGRMEKIDEGQQFQVIVDYAHSPESLRAFFENLPRVTIGKVIVVFGGCGERDPAMRPVMGAILDSHSNTVIVTNDDPYSEDPESISGQLLDGIVNKERDRDLFVILDRRDAIKKALLAAHDGDIVCILGKGAEQWQVFKNKKIPWDDRVVVRELLHEKISQPTTLKANG